MLYVILLFWFCQWSWIICLLQLPIQERVCSPLLEDGWRGHWAIPTLLNMLLNSLSRMTLGVLALFSLQIFTARSSTCWRLSFMALMEAPSSSQPIHGSIRGMIILKVELSSKIKWELCNLYVSCFVTNISMLTQNHIVVNRHTYHHKHHLA